MNKEHLIDFFQSIINNINYQTVLQRKLCIDFFVQYTNTQTTQTTQTSNDKNDELTYVALAILLKNEIDKISIQQNDSNI